MSYYKKKWANSPATTSPINDENLNHIEQGINDAYNLVQDASGTDLVEWVDGKYITTNGATIDYSSPTTSASYRYAIVDCVEGDKFTISAEASSAARVWAFGDAAGNNLKKAANGLVANNLVITAPAGATKLVLNDNTKTGACFKGVSIPERLTKYDYTTDASQKNNDRLTVFDGKVIAYDWEKAYISATNPLTITSVNTRIMCGHKKTINVLKGTVISLSDFTGVKMNVYYKLASATNFSNTGFQTTSYTTVNDVQIMVVLAKSDDSSISDIVSLADLLTISQPINPLADIDNSIPIKNVCPKLETSSNHGMTFTVNSANEITISGSLSGANTYAQKNIIYNTESFPTELKKNVNYVFTLLNATADTHVFVYEYTSGGSTKILDYYGSGFHYFTLGNDVTGFALYFRVTEDSVGLTLKPMLYIADSFSGEYDTNSIIGLNKDQESAVIQNTALRDKAHYPNDIPTLSFAHFSDIHSMPKLWDRIAEYCNYYNDYLDAVVFTGDYVGDNQSKYDDLLVDGKPFVKPPYMCVGNHDTYANANHDLATKSSVYDILFSQVSKWTGATFMEGDSSMTYYVDFASKKIRMIVLDNYYDTEEQVTWLENVLEDAQTLEYGVITFSHEQTATITNLITDCTFCTLDDDSSMHTNAFETTLKNFVDGGGVHICHFAGHHHRSYFGYTNNGILNLLVPAATTFASYNDNKRETNSKTYDCFNIVGIDTNVGMLKVVRIGNDRDHYNRSQKTFCYDYVNRRLVFND